MRPSKITISIPHELLIVLALSIATVVAAQIWQASPLRLALGLLYILFLPGYALVAALFPGRADLQGIRRLTLSLVSSLALVSLITLILNWTPWGVTLAPILVSVTSFVGLACGVAYFRRSRLPPEERFVPHVEIRLPSRTSMSVVEKTLMIGLTLSIILAVGTVVYFVIHPKVTERYTEFYVLGASGSLEGYPVEAIEGEPMTLILGVVNHEHEYVDYRMVRDVSGRNPVEMQRIELAHGEKWEEPITFALSLDEVNDAACFLETVSFLLYKEGQSEPYRSVYLQLALLPATDPFVSATLTPTPPTATPTETPSPFPTPTASPPAASPAPEPTSIPTSWTIHAVQPGETLSAISRLYGVSVDALILANDLTDPDLIEVDQEILIPQ
jgi:uncharacterized membrane protein